MAESTSLLTPENYQRGFLIDDECMAGVSEDADQPGHFAAFVLSHVTGESIGYEIFPNLDLALCSINSVQRGWKFEASSACGGCEDGSCGKGACSQSCQTTGKCELDS